MKENLEQVGYYIGLGVSVLIAYWTYGRKQGKALIKLNQEISVWRKKYFESENRHKQIKLSFNVAYNQYEQILTPEQMSMLKDIKRIIENGN